MARLLSVTEFAHFSGALLVSATFCMLGGMGTYFLLQRDWPTALARGRGRAGAVLLMQTTIVACACALAAVLIAALGVSVAGLPSSLLALSVVYGFGQQWFLAVTLESRSRGQTMRYASQNLVRSLALFCTGISAALLTASTYWVLAVETVVSLMLTASIFRRILMDVVLPLTEMAAVAWRRMHMIAWRSALALLLSGILGFILINVDRWLAAELFDAKAFAQYAFVGTVLMIAQSLQALVNAWAFPMLARRHADRGPHFAFRLCVQLSGVTFGLGALAILPLWWVLDLAIRLWYPSYTESLVLLPLFLVLGTFRVADFWSSFLVISGHEMLFIKLQLTIGLLGAVLWAPLVLPLSPAGTPLVQVGGLALFLGIAIYVVAATASWKIARIAQPTS